MADRTTLVADETRTGPTFRSSDAVKSFAIVAATIVVPYALCPLIILLAVMYYGALGIGRLISAVSRRAGSLLSDTGVSQRTLHQHE
jgi:hypothetical protein